MLAVYALQTQAGFVRGVQHPKGRTEANKHVAEEYPGTAATAVECTPQPLHAH